MGQCRIPEYNTTIRNSRCCQLETIKALIFNAGNEYRKFETFDVTHTTMGIESVEWDGKGLSWNVWTDEPRTNYVYHEDANGAFYIRNSDNRENDVTTEYVIVNFRLKANRQNNDIFINANWTNDRFLDKYKMVYDPATELYTASIKLKQGYYSYQYLSLDSEGKSHPLASEGNFSKRKTCIGHWSITEEAGSALTSL